MHTLPKNFQNIILNLENHVELNYFSAYSFGNNDFLVSSYFSDECFYHKEGHDYLESQSKLHPHFDLASLTKPLFLNAWLRMQHKHDFLKYVDRPLKDLLSEKHLFYPSLKKLGETHPNLALNQLLSHQSPLAPWCWMGVGFWDRIPGKSLRYHQDPKSQKNWKSLINNILEHILQYPLQKAEYGDLNYFLLPRILECTADEQRGAKTYLNSYQGDPLAFWAAQLQDINQHLDSCFLHSSLNGEATKYAVPYYPYIAVPNDLIEFHGESFGFVHDTNANILSQGGSQARAVSGHAGLFGSVLDVFAGVRFLQETQRAFVSQNPLKKTGESSRFFWGLDTPTTLKSSAGIQQTSTDHHRIFGHLGYTGTSFWFTTEDTPHNLHILLTNRTSSRSVYTLPGVPRILIVTHVGSKESLFFLKSGHTWLPVSLDTVCSINHESFFLSQKIWNKDQLRVLPDINALRRFCGQQLWEI